MPDAAQPNILVIWGDDIGITNLSCYSDGLMGYRTPNIDRIADEGMRFTDSYGEQSCTAGRSSFITGQSVFRTGLSKVGIPAGATSTTSTPRRIPSRRTTRRPTSFPTSASASPLAASFTAGPPSTTIPPSSPGGDASASSGSRTPAR